VSTADDNVRLAQEGFDAFNRGDVDAVLAMLDPEVEVFASADFPNSGTFHGREGYLRWVGEWLEAWDRFEIEVLEIEPVGDAHVISLVHQRGRGRGSGIEVTQDVAFMWEVQDARAVRLHLYPDRDAALAAVGRESRAAD
jgi:ketosteroid isomerase-like protein